MRTRITVLCLFVCHQSAGTFSHLYDKLYLSVCSSLGFQLTDFNKTVYFGRLCFSRLFGSFPTQSLPGYHATRTRFLKKRVTVRAAVVSISASIHLPTSNRPQRSQERTCLKRDLRNQYEP